MPFQDAEKQDESQLGCEGRFCQGYQQNTELNAKHSSPQPGPMWTGASETGGPRAAGYPGRRTRGCRAVSFRKMLWESRWGKLKMGWQATLVSTGNREPPSARRTGQILGRQHKPEKPTACYNRAWILSRQDWIKDVNDSSWKTGT